MNDLIDKYIYNVSKDLPNKIKEEVIVELESNIYDMLGDDFSIENTEKVLY